MDDPLLEMKRTVVALGAELPEAVWLDVKDRFNALSEHVQQLRVGGDYNAADHLHDVLVAGQVFLDAKDALLACYRIGRQPSEAFWRRYDEAKARWAAVQPVTDKETGL